MLKYIAARLSEASTWKAIGLGVMQVVAYIQPQYAPMAQAAQAVILAHTVATPDPVK